MRLKPQIILLALLLLFTTTIANGEAVEPQPDGWRSSISICETQANSSLAGNTPHPAELAPIIDPKLPASPTTGEFANPEVGRNHREDCNGNDIPDNCDLDCGSTGSECDMPGCGTSTDCNQNEIPDDCEDSVPYVTNTMTGVSFCSIQEAIDAATAGDELEVHPGVYPENVDFHGKNVTLWLSSVTVDGNISSTGNIIAEDGEVMLAGSYLHGIGASIACESGATLRFGDGAGDDSVKTNGRDLVLPGGDDLGSSTYEFATSAEVHTSGGMIFLGQLLTQDIVVRFFAPVDTGGGDILVSQFVYSDVLEIEFHGPLTTSGGDFTLDPPDLLGDSRRFLFAGPVDLGSGALYLDFEDALPDFSIFGSFTAESMHFDFDTSKRTGATQPGVGSGQFVFGDDANDLIDIKGGLTGELCFCGVESGGTIRVGSADLSLYCSGGTLGGGGLTADSDIRLRVLYCDKVSLGGPDINVFHGNLELTQEDSDVALMGTTVVEGGLRIYSTPWDTLHIPERVEAQNGGLLRYGQANIEGVLAIQGAQTFVADQCSFAGDGHVEVLDAASLSVIPPFSGDPSFGCNLLNTGTLGIDIGHEQTHILSIDAEYAQPSSGVLSLKIGGTEPGPGGHDALEISGHAALGGVLDVELLGRFSPSLGDEFEIIAFQSAAGDFDEYRLPELDDGICFDSRFIENALWLEVASDCNDNGISDQKDIERKISRDCNENGIPDECDGLPSCDYDLDYNCTMGSGDVDLIKGNFGPTTPENAIYDLDGSGFVGVGDINLIKANYGPCPG